VFGNPDDSKGGVLKGEDRPLPWELAPRVSRWAVAEHERGITGSDDEYSSVNAHIRADIRASRL
jgi:hypothetical protein